jgi:TonB-dependent starch-binding outer membrane protein SusC
MRTLLQPLLLKILFAGLAVSVFVAAAHAVPGISDNPADIYININKRTIHLKQLFALIEKQTRFSFAYDETDITLSKQVRLTTGLQSVKKVLDMVSRQTGLYFTENDKANLILVRNTAGIFEIEQKRPASLDTLVRGVVRDAEGVPLRNVTVAVKGTTTAVQTDMDGNFTIPVPANAILVFTIVGYSPQEIQIEKQTSLSISMQVLNKDLNEVVVVGYQPQRRADLAGAVSVINVSGIAKLPVGSLDQALQGKAPGVRITQSTGQPGEGIAVRIRGVGTINDNNPLFIIDGIPTKDGINFLSPNEIESIVVLKDASSAAIYGARAANGVVVVTTKSGKRGAPQFSYSEYQGIQTHGTLPKMLNTPQYIELYNEAVANDNMDIANASLKRKLLPDTIPMANTDWLKAIFQNALIMSHELSVMGGSDRVRYYISGNYFKQDGIILNSWYERYALLSKLNLDLTSRLTLANNINISYTKRNVIGSSGDGYGGNGGSVIRYALFRTPAIPIYNGDGSYTDLPDYPNFFGDGYNPVALAEKTDNKETQYRVFTNVYAEYKVLKNLRFKSDAGLDVIITNAKRFDENYGTNLRINSPSRLTESAADNFNFIWNNTLRYNTILNEVHNLSAVVGTEAISNRSRIQGGSDSKFAEQIPNLRYLGLGLSLSKNVFEGQQEWALFSLFGNVNYTYNNRYLFSFNVRRDGSSRFSEANKYGTFYSGSAGWNIHNEKWAQDRLPAFSKIKLRASFGQLGNQDIGNYPWASIIGRGYNYVFGAPPAPNPGYTINSRGNEKVKWESSTQGDAGLDLGLWKNKLNLTVDYYVKRTSDMLIPIPLPLIGGSAATPYVNAGKVENKGLELELNYSNNSHSFKYDLSVNFATLKNKVLSLASGEPIPGGRIDNGVYATLTTVGQPIGSFYLYQMEGIFQNQADIIASAYQGNYIRPGDVKFKDVYADGVINEKDRTFLGSAIPKYTYGATANFIYSNFDLSLFFQGQYGNKLYLQVNQDIEGFYRAFNLTQRVYDERWQGEGTSNTMPRVSWLGSTNNKTPSSRFLEDGSYVRLKNIQLGYTIPQKVTERWKVKALRIYFTGQNLWTFTKYTGLDPEMHTSNNLNAEKYRGDIAAGIDWGTYPSAKSYIIGVNLNF